jgi:translation initiation factor RLI1
VKQRIKASKAIRSLLKQDNYVIVVEHDLAVLDYLSDFIWSVEMHSVCVYVYLYVFSGLSL